MQTLSRLGDFVLEREIGQGGMGVVYLALEESLGRRVALKVLPYEFTRDPMRLSRFKLEAEVISRLDHPSIVPVYGVGECEGYHYIAMKYLEGEDLDQVIKNRLPPEEQFALRLEAKGVAPTHVLSAPGTESAVLPQAPMMPGAAPETQGISRLAITESEVGWVFRCLRIIERVALALEHAHQRGVIHRDVKPSNIILDRRGDPCLLDFGLVRDMETCEQSLTATGGILGTAFYMPPEQLRQEKDEIDHRVDIYALGVTLYELVTLRRPFPYQSPDVLFHAIVNEEPVPPRRVNPRLPRDLETVILKALEKDASKRYQSAAQFADDLRRVRSFEPIEAKPISFFGRTKKWVHRNPVLAGTMLFALLSFVGMVEYSVYRNMVDDRRAQEALEAGNKAFDAGAEDQALHHYHIYLALGGDREVIGPRLLELTRFPKAPQKDPAPSSK